MGIRGDLRKLMEQSKKDRERKNDLISEELFSLKKGPIDNLPEGSEERLDSEVQKNESEEKEIPVEKGRFQEAIDEYRENKSLEGKIRSKGRPKRSASLKFKRISISMKSDLYSKFIKIKGNTKRDGASSKVSLLMEEYEVWQRILGRFSRIIEKELLFIEGELSKGNIPYSKIKGLLDYISIIGLTKADVIKYINKKLRDVFILSITIGDRMESENESRDNKKRK